MGLEQYYMDVRFCKGRELFSVDFDEGYLIPVTWRSYRPSTVETLYNTVNFCWSTHKGHSIARPKGRGMGWGVFCEFKGQHIVLTYQNWAWKGEVWGGVSFVSSKGNILCWLIKIELYKIFALINRAIKSLHCISNPSQTPLPRHPHRKNMGH